MFCTKICLLGFFSPLTWKYLDMLWHVIFNIYTFVSTWKLCTNCLFRCFLSNSILFWWISVTYFNFCATLLWLLMWHILKAIWKSMHWHLNISINNKVLFFRYKNFIEKMKRLHMAITTFVQLFGTSITLLHLLMPLMLSSFLSIQRHPLVFYKGGCLNYSTHPLLAFQKK